MLTIIHYQLSTTPVQESVACLCRIQVFDYAGSKFTDDYAGFGVLGPLWGRALGAQLAAIWGPFYLESTIPKHHYSVSILAPAWRSQHLA